MTGNVPTLAHMSLQPHGGPEEQKNVVITYVYSLINLYLTRYLVNHDGFK